MKNINLKTENIEDILNLIVKKNLKTTIFETGEIGMLNLHILLQNYQKENEIKIGTTMYVELINEPGADFVNYILPNKNYLLIIHNPKLDEKINIDNETGFPIKSNILYFKEEEIINTLSCPKITTERCDGNTTRQVNYAIENLFKNKKIIVNDHWENGTNRLANIELFNKILKRLKEEIGISVDETNTKRYLIINKNNMTLMFGEWFKTKKI